jgi:pyruvate dehydrogenase E2 component (dihydrolipoamide acetyltransferase)
MTEASGSDAKAMATPIRMPKLGQSMTEGKVMEWLRNEGDRVDVGEPLLSIETDKADVEMESPASGYLRGVRAASGDVVKVGTTIAWLTESQSDEVPDDSVESEAVAVKQAPAPSEHDEQAGSVGGEAAARSSEKGPRVASSPLARRRAGELGVDLAAVIGTGPGGRITRADIENAAARRRPEPAGPAVPRERLPAAKGVDARFESKPVTRMRQAIAASMTASATVPQFRLTREVELSRLALYLSNRSESFTDSFVLALGKALRRHPAVNSSWVEGSPRRIVVHKEVNVALAVAVSDGLVVPTIPNTDQLSLAEIHENRIRIESEARAGRLNRSNLTEATFTLSNLGAMGVDEFDALINPPQAGILAIGSVAQRPIARDGGLFVATTVRVTLSGDHRVFDGLEGARFLQSFVEEIDNIPASGA